MLNKHGKLVFMSPRVELKLLLKELSEWQLKITDTQDIDELEAYWEAWRGVTERIDELRQHMNFANWQEGKRKSRNKYLEAWLYRHYADNEESLQRLEEYEQTYSTS